MTPLERSFPLATIERFIGTRWVHHTGHEYVVEDVVKMKAGASWFDGVLYRRVFNWLAPWKTRPRFVRPIEDFERKFVEVA